MAEGFYYPAISGWTSADHKEVWHIKAEMVKNPLNVLLELGLVNYLSENGINMKHFDANGLVVEAFPRDSQLLKRNMKDFEMDIISGPVNFETPSCKLLLKHNSGEVNTNVLAFFQAKLKCMGLECPVNIDISENECILYSKSRTKLHEALFCIQKSVEEMNISLQDKSEVEDTIASGERLNKLRTFPLKNNRVGIVCTADFSEQLRGELTVKFVFTPEESEYFSTFGKEMLETKARQCDMKVLKYNKKQGVMFMRAESKPVSASKVQLRKAIHEYIQKQRLRKSENLSKVKDIEEKVLSVCQQQKCSLSMQCLESKESVIKKYITWSIKDKHLTLVGEDESKQNSKQNDKAVLVLTNTSYYPILKFGNDDCDDISKITLSLAARKGHQAAIGDFQPLFQKAVPYFIKVVMETPISRTSLPDRISLTNNIADGLRKLSRKSYNEICLPAVADEHFTKGYGWPDVFVDAFLQIECSMKCNLLVANDVDSDMVAADINQAFTKNTWKFGVTREVFSADLIVDEFHEVEIAIDTGSIVDQQVDMLTNTVGKTFNIQRGFISQAIAKKAGNDLDKYCSSFYPNGLKDEQCVVTPSFDLMKKGIHYIAHCVLPDFQKKKFKKTLKSMVKKCLIEADIRRCSSIAIPPFGTGHLQYPLRDTAFTAFRAVKEYQYEAVNSVLKKVVFVVYGNENDRLVKVFRRMCQLEERSRPDVTVSKCQHVHGFRTQLGKDEEERINVFVSDVYPLKTLPATTVLMTFKHGQPEEAKFRAGEYNDEIVVTLDKEGLEHGITNGLQKCFDEQVTDLAVIYPPTGDSQSQKATFLETLVAELKKWNNRRFLTNVYILFPHFDDVRSMQSTLCPKTFISSMKRPFGFGIEWEYCDDNDHEVAITIIGTKDATGKAKEQIENLLEPKDIKTPQRTEVEDNEDESSYEIIDMPATEEYSLKTTAYLNRGIVKYLLQCTFKQEWEIEMKNTFNVTVQIEVNEEGHATGNVGDVAKFETYLSLDFPKLPETKSVQSSDGLKSNQMNKQVGVDHEIILCDDEFEIHVSVGDIISMKEVCIFVPTDENLSWNRGVAKAVSERIGEKYNAECTHRIRDQGKLLHGECRICQIVLPCGQRIIQGCVPSLRKGVNVESLLLLRKTLVKCFETVTAYGMKSVAIPAVGTGSLLSAMDSAKCIQEALWEHRKMHDGLDSVSLILFDANMRKDYVDSMKEFSERGIPTGLPNKFENSWSLKNDIKVIIVTKTDVHQNSSCNVFICPQEAKGRDNSDIVKFLTPDDQKKVNDHACNKSEVGSILHLKHTCQDLFNKPILFVKSPRWNKGIPELSLFKQEVKTAMSKTLGKCAEIKALRIATSVMGLSVNEEEFATPIKTCCEAMVEAMMGFKGCKFVIEVHFSTYPRHAVSMIDVLKAIAVRETTV